MATTFVRQTAIPCTLEEIRSGAWVQNDGMTPSGVRHDSTLISRASTIGVIIQQTDGNNFVLDDGSGQINVRSFDTTPAPVRAAIGDVVLVIGRPREYNGERYMVLEICKKLKHTGWINYRKRELDALQHKGTLPISRAQVVSERSHEVNVEVTSAQQKNPFEIIVEQVRALDEGNGAEIDEVLARVTIPDVERLVKTLLEEGEIYEIRPGRVKVLE